MGTRAAARLLITDEQRAGLEAMAKSPSLSHRAVRQARGLLDAADGVGNEEIGRRCGVSANTVRAGRGAFTERGGAGGGGGGGRGGPWPKAVAARGDGRGRGAGDVDGEAGRWVDALVESDHGQAD